MLCVSYFNMSMKLVRMVTKAHHARKTGKESDITTKLKKKRRVKFYIDARSEEATKCGVNMSATERLLTHLRGAGRVADCPRPGRPRVICAIITDCHRNSQLAFYVNLHRAVIGPSATLTGR